MDDLLGTDELVNLQIQFSADDAEDVARVSFLFKLLIHLFQMPHAQTLDQPLESFIRDLCLEACRMIHANIADSHLC